jgi:hypothetical protein
MSIRDEINRHVANRALFHLLPLLEGSRVARTMFISAEVMEVADPFVFADDWDGRRLQMVRPMLDTFINGRLIGIATKPHNKDGSAFLARVDPVQDEVWDIRVIDPVPGVRVFGRFSEFNTFVALNWNLRENLKREEHWAEQIQDCIQQWQKLFPAHSAHSSSKVSDYVQEPFIAV